jgi:cytoskeletal protein CcmA (bactofilin family)
LSEASSSHAKNGSNHETAGSFCGEKQMAPAKAALKLEPTIETESVAEKLIHRVPAPALPDKIPQRLPDAVASIQSPTPVRSVSALSGTVPTARPRRDNYNFQARVPAITGEASFRGWISVDGIISGQLGANGSSLTIKQRPHCGAVLNEPELTGEVHFRDMLRINGHIAGKVTSPKGTLIVDGSALVDGDIDVGAVVIGGTVNGDVIAHERVELGPAAVINGNISTRTLTMKPGAIFQGDCRMLRNENGEK